MKPLTKEDVYQFTEHSLVEVKNVLSALALTKKKIDEAINKSQKAFGDETIPALHEKYIKQILDECFQI